MLLLPATHTFRSIQKHLKLFLSSTFEAINLMVRRVRPDAAREQPTNTPTRLLFHSRVEAAPLMQATTNAHPAWIDREVKKETDGALRLG